ncbi:MAG: undecaprenyl-diphosphate phosphatase [Prevotella sp.]|nr:undecaprenyl-diphosphate phosphatase [Prevotella sp.]
MDWIQALLLGIVQGLTEYLPVSSSGHLELGKALLGAEAGGLRFDIIVHVATVLSTLAVLWKEIAWLFRGLFRWQWNDETRYIAAIIISMIPVAVVGVFFKDTVEALYSGCVVRVTGICLIITALLLALAHYFPDGFSRKPAEKVSPLNALVIGIAQACAVLPGLSRSGSTIATGLLLGVDRRRMAQFSFIMVIPPILGEALLDFKDLAAPGAAAEEALPVMSAIIGFAAAFVFGCLACKWMIALVKKCKLIWFAAYCLVVGCAALVCS